MYCASNSALRNASHHHIRSLYNGTCNAARTRTLFDCNKTYWNRSIYFYGRRARTLLDGRHLDCSCMCHLFHLKLDLNWPSETCGSIPERLSSTNNSSHVGVIVASEMPIGDSHLLMCLTSETLVPSYMFVVVDIIDDVIVIAAVDDDWFSNQPSK